MKKVLKFVALLLTFVMISASFAACGKDENDDNKRIKKHEKSTSESVDKGENESVENGDIIENGGLFLDNNRDDNSDKNNQEKIILRMATNAAFPPYEYYEDDEIVGIDIEIAELIVAKLGVELEIIDMDFNGIITAVQNCSVDFGMAGITPDAERLESVNFSTRYITNTQVVIVNADSDIRTIYDLSGKIIGVKEATTGDAYATEDFGEDAVRRYVSGEAAAAALNAGAIDVVIIDEKIAETLVSSTNAFTILETKYAVEDYAIAVAKDNPELLGKINKAIEELQAEGKIDEIIAEYIR